MKYLAQYTTIKQTDLSEIIFSRVKSNKKKVVKFTKNDSTNIKLGLESFIDQKKKKKAKKKKKKWTHNILSIHKDKTQKHTHTQSYFLLSSCLRSLIPILTYAKQTMSTKVFICRTRVQFHPSWCCSCIPSQNPWLRPRSDSLSQPAYQPETKKQTHDVRYFKSCSSVFQKQKMCMPHTHKKRKKKKREQKMIKLGTTQQTGKTG